MAAGIRSAFDILSISGCLFTEIVSFKYFSIIKDAIGEAHVEPYPAFSTTTAMAILGFSLGAKATNKEWFFPCGFCAVPVLAQILMPSILALIAVPIVVTSCMPNCTALNAESEILVTLCFFRYLPNNAVSAMVSFSILSTKWGT